MFAQRCVVEAGEAYAASVSDLAHQSARQSCSEADEERRSIAESKEAWRSIVEADVARRGIVEADDEVQRGEVYFGRVAQRGAARMAA